ncbi:hypothetical protein CFOL_v3_17571, partial [Cephalotus follicularis]
GYLV